MTRRAQLLRLLPALVLGGALGGLFVAFWPKAPAPPLPPRAVSLQIPQEQELLDFTVSSDGTQIAYTAIVDGQTNLYLRRLHTFDAQMVPATIGATQPFFSPDGTAVAFFADGWLQTATLNGEGRTTRVCPVPGSTGGGAWREDGVLVFAGPGATGLQQVAATGGTPTVLTTLDTENGETAHGWPSVVDEQFLLFTVGRYGRDPRLTLLDLNTGESRPLLPADGGGFAVAPSLFVYARRGELFAAPLELIEPDGAPAPRPLLNFVATSTLGYQGLGRARFAATRDGTLVFAPPSETGANTQLVWVNRDGRATPIDDVTTRHGTPRLSPTGQQIAFSAATAILRRDLWLYDFATGQRQQLTENAGDNHSPVWGPASNNLTFASSRSGLQRIFPMSLPSRTTTGPLFDGDQRTPGSWSPDSRLWFYEIDPERGRDIWQWSESTEGPTRWLAPPHNERAPRISPDGRWVAYVSDGLGTGDQVYLREANTELQQNADPLQLSPVGGTEPVWSKNSDRLFFRKGRGLYEVSVHGDEPPASDPVHLFDGLYLSDVLDNLPAYDVADDDSRFLMLQLDSSTTVIHLMSNWQSNIFPPVSE